jgi:hypothetical protein
MIANAYSSTLHRPTATPHAAPHACGSANEAVDLLLRLLIDQ